MYSTFQVNTTVKQTDKGMAIDKMVMGVQFYNGDNRVSGQVVLDGDADSITLETSFDEISKKAIEKAKSFIASSEDANAQQPTPATDTTPDAGK